MLLELSIIIFVIWIIGLVLYKTINILSPKGISEESLNLKTGTFYDEPIIPKKFDDLKKQNPKIEYVILEKQKEEDLFSLEEYRQMRALLEVIKKSKK